MEILLRCLEVVQRLLCWLVIPIYYLLTLRQYKPLPPIKEEIVLQSATELARKIRNREYTSTQVVKAFINRCKEVNPSLNAIVEDCFDDALKEAADVDEIISKGLKTKEELAKDTPFLGVPFSVKESISLKGKSISVGCLPRLGIKHISDPPAVHNLRRAGAIPIAVTNTPELCFCSESNNLTTGCTNNPYDFHRTPGGSSGGDAALLSSAASVIALGSDIAGSIRVPGSFTGIFCHKTSPGYVSVEGHYPYSADERFARHLTIGPVTRYAEDLKPLLKVLAGDKASALKLDEEVNLKKLRVMYAFELSSSPFSVQTHKDIKKAIEKAVKHFNKQYGCPINKPYIEEFEDALEISTTMVMSIDGLPDLLDHSKSSVPKKNRSLYTEFIKGLFGLSEFSCRAVFNAICMQHNGFVPIYKKNEYLTKLKTLKEKFENLLGDDGVFIVPSFPSPAFHHGQYLMRTTGVVYPLIFSALEAPAISVPMGLNKNGLPIGIQVVAAQNQDRLCLAVAEELSRAFGGWVPPS